MAAQKVAYTFTEFLCTEDYDGPKDRAYRFLDQHRLARRQVILTQPGQIDELSKAPYEVLSFGQAVDEVHLQFPRIIN